MENLNDFLARRQEILDRGILNWGNLQPLKTLFKRAEEGDTLTISFIGGSITQGCLATAEERQYTHRIHEWFCQKFPKASFTYLNAPVGGTDSQFGVARVEQDILEKNPDFLIVEFTVNDKNEPFYMETYEGLVRKVLSWPEAPAVLLLMNCMYDGQGSAQEQHLPVAVGYNLPCVSMRESFLAEVEAGRMTSQDLTVDNLHPNDFGHEQVADMVINFLGRVMRQTDALRPPLTPNRFQGSMRYQNRNCEPELKGFEPDFESQASSWYYFANGWRAGKTGDTIIFSASGTSLAVQYRKCAKHPAPVAAAVVDGDEAHPIVLDANFDQDWGDCLYLQLLAEDLPDTEHTVAIRLTETHENDTADFYLVSLIAGRGCARPSMKA